MLNAFFAIVDSLGFDVADAEASASLRAGLRTQGRPIGPYDVLIAGTALARGLTVITSNVGEFGRIAGLRVENWR
jgi:tRNA(fMet)-specific endonuclease VapC